MPLPVSSTVSATCPSELAYGDVAYFRVPLSETGRLTALAHGRDAPNRLSLYDAAGRLLIQSDGQSPSDLAAHIRKARELVAQYPMFKPELFVTEFNVLQGGRGDEAAGDLGALPRGRRP